MPLEATLRPRRAWTLAAAGGPGEPVFTGGNAAVWRRRHRCPPAGAKGDRTPSMVSCPLLTPLTFLRTRLPSVARLNARGPQGHLVLQEYTIDRSRAFRSGKRTPCTEWPRTVMRGKSRKVNSGHNSVPKPARRTEPSPRNPRFAAHLRCVSAKEGLGSQEGTGNHWFPVPFCPCRWAPASPPPDGGIPAGEHRLPRPPKAATVHAHFERKFASSGAPLYRRKVYRQLTVKRIFIYPSAEGCSE